VCLYNFSDNLIDSSQAKENADDLLAEKKAIDTQVDAKRKEARDAELAMRQKASAIGNIVNKGVPVSQTEVFSSHPAHLSHVNRFLSRMTMLHLGRGTQMGPMRKWRRRQIFWHTMRSCSD
jgi:seryl-tRNA synthetase